MKIHEIKEMKTEEIIQRIKDEEQSLVDLRFSHQLKQLTNTSKIKKCEKRYCKAENCSSGKRNANSR